MSTSKSRRSTAPATAAGSNNRKHVSMTELAVLSGPALLMFAIGAIGGNCWGWSHETAALFIFGGILGGFVMGAILRYILVRVGFIASTPTSAQQNNERQLQRR